MNIEILYPELCCLYGEKGNMMFLKQCLPEANFIETRLNDRPTFLDQNVSLCYIGSCSEQSQELLLDKLRPFKDKIKALIETKKTLFLATGNAMELFVNKIVCEDQREIEALGIVSGFAKRQAPQRFNTLLKTKFKDMTVIGYTSRFSHTYDLDPDHAFCEVEIGTGSQPNTKYDGIYQGGLIATYCIGNLLVSNPDFTHWLLQQLNCDKALPFEKEIRKAYEVKLQEFTKPHLELA